MVLVSPADHAQHVKERADEENTCVSTWTGEQHVKTAQDLDETKASHCTGGVSSALAARD